MSITFVAAARSTSAVDNVLLKTCPKPTGTVENDVMAAHVWGYRETVTSAPSGWTLLQSNVTSEALANDFNFNSYLYRKVAGGSEPADYTWETTTDTSPTPTRRVVIASYRGCLTSAPVESSATAETEDAAGPTLTFPSLTTLGANRMIVAMASAAITLPTGTMPGPWTERFDQVGQFVYDHEQAIASATGTGVLTLTQTMTSWGFVLALVPVNNATGFRNYCNNVNLEVA